MRSFLFALVSSVVASSLAGCAQGGSGHCTESSECRGGRCVDGMCVGARDAGGGGDDAGQGDAGPLADAAPPLACTSSAECDDADACTTDACTGGACTRTPVVCDDGDACTDDACDPATGCATTPTSCDDGDACTVDSCDSAIGCAHAPTAVAGGSCANPIDISAGGTFTGDSTCASSDWSGVCLGASGPDIAFVLDLATETDVQLDASASSFTAVLFVGPSCGDDSSACDSDGTPTISVRLPAGRHHVGLDGRTSTAAGTFRLDVQLTPVVRDELLTFPSASDAHVTAQTNYWNAGDSIQGSRTTSLATITSADLTLSVSPNGLTCDNQDMQLSINGTVVGAVTISPGASTFSQSYSFAAISGPTYTIRLQTIRTVNGGCGSAGFPDGVSTLRIRR